MKRILVTGAREPAALDLIRKLSLSGFEVYAADSVNYPLSRASNKVEHYFVLTPPAKNTTAFIHDLEKIIVKHKIDLVIPTCEEVFFISKYKEQLENHCVIFCDSFNMLSRLHNKYTFLEEAKYCGALIPETHLIQNQNSLTALPDTRTKVLKPVYSRFAAHTLICKDEHTCSQIPISPDFPWVAQEYVPGIEYCTYSIAVAGKLQAHSCYQPTYRAGLGSGIYFSPVQKPEIQDFVANFVKKHHYTGQIGFDFIYSSDHQLYVLECNPRATSGIHCLPDQSDWHKILSGTMEHAVGMSAEPKMVGLAMVTFGLKYWAKIPLSTWFRDFIKATDPVWHRNDIAPHFYQFVSLAEIIFKSLTQCIPLKEAATADIEWNGQTI